MIKKEDLRIHNWPDLIWARSKQIEMNNSERKEPLAIPEKNFERHREKCEIEGWVIVNHAYEKTSNISLINAIVTIQSMIASIHFNLHSNDFRNDLW